MLKSIKSNNSPGHLHNGHSSVVGLSFDSCPGNISKEGNKMKEQTNALKTLVEIQGSRVHQSSHYLTTVAEQIKSLGNSMISSTFKAKDLSELIELKYALKLASKQLDNDIRSWAKASSSRGNK